MAHLTATDWTPFSIDNQLCSDLDVQSTRGGLMISSTTGRNRLPGQPLMPLSAPKVYDHLKTEFGTPKLNRMAPHLWLLATPSSTHISPLHAQVVRGRAVTISEDPELHLVWLDHRVFIKPIPKYLLSHAFWQYYLDPSVPGNATNDEKGQLREAILGYMRSYFFLVRHESDYRMAAKHHLIPENVGFEEFMDFISGFGNVREAQVSPRYHYGELRLSRLNAWARILLRQSHFHKVAWQYADVFARYYVPYLFIFSIITVVLSAMQVGVSAKAEWGSFISVSAWFSVATLALICLIALALILELGIMMGREMIFAIGKQIEAGRTSNKQAQV